MSVTCEPECVEVMRTVQIPRRAGLVAARGPVPAVAAEEPRKRCTFEISQPPPVANLDVERRRTVLQHAFDGSGHNTEGHDC